MIPVQLPFLGWSLIVVLVISWCLSGGAAAQTLVERTNGGVVKLMTSPDARSIQMAQDLANVVNFVPAAGPLGPTIFTLLKVTVEPASDDAATALQKLCTAPRL
jgi:hypothetical protein